MAAAAVLCLSSAPGFFCRERLARCPEFRVQSIAESPAHCQEFRAQWSITVIMVGITAIWDWGSCTPQLKASRIAIATAVVEA